MIANISIPRQHEISQWNEFMLGQLFVDSCRENDLPMVHYLNNRYQIDVNTYHSDGYQGIHYACVNGYLDIIKYLMEANVGNKEAWINIQYNTLGLTAKNNHTDVLDYLFHLPKDSNFIKQHDISHCMKLALTEDHHELIQYFIFHLNTPMNDDIEDLAYSGDNYFLLDLFEKRNLNIKLKQTINTEDNKTVTKVKI